LRLWLPGCHLLGFRLRPPAVWAAVDFARYGAEMALVKQALERLQQLVPASGPPAP
jgi:hypothetical protein